MSKLTDQDLADWRAKRTGRPPAADLANNLAKQPAPASPTLLNWPPAAPHKQHHHTVQSLTVDAATAVIGAGSSSRNIVEVVREVMRRSTLVLCPADSKDPAHVRELLSALEAFARFECAFDQTMSGCTDCPSVGCTPF